MKSYSIDGAFFTVSDEEYASLFPPIIPDPPHVPTSAEIAAQALVVPDGPTLSDWRVGLTLWGRMDDVSAKVAALIASPNPAVVIIGKIAKERLEYANNVFQAQLLQLKDAVGFSAADVEESLWRAHQVSLGDLSGKWPL